MLNKIIFILLLAPLIVFAREKHRKDPFLILDVNHNEGKLFQDLTVFNRAVQTQSGTPTIVSGFKGAGIQYGSSSIRVTEDARFYAMTDCTMSVWINSTADGSGQEIMSRYNNGISDAWMRFSLIPSYYFQIQINGNSGVNGTFVPQINTWYHVVAKTEGNIYKLFVNGKLDISSTRSGSQPAISNSEMWIGSFHNAALFFTGRMDNVKIWDRALSDIEISRLYMKELNETGHN